MKKWSKCHRCHTPDGVSPNIGPGSPRIVRKWSELSKIWVLGQVGFRVIPTIFSRQLSSGILSCSTKNGLKRRPLCDRNVWGIIADWDKESLGPLGLNFDCFRCFSRQVARFCPQSKHLNAPKYQNCQNDEKRVVLRSHSMTGSDAKIHSDDR